MPLSPPFGWRGRVTGDAILALALFLGALGISVASLTVAATGLFAMLLRLAAAHDRLSARFEERTREVDLARTDILERLARAAEFRDDDTQQHAERIGVLAALLGGELGLADGCVHELRRAAPLHDVGKLAVPDAILRKPGPLDADELAVMRAHTTAGACILSGARSPVLQLAEDIALTHHERRDGTGYPYGLAGSAIPIGGRIVAVADVYDVLVHERPYKPAWPVEDAIAEIAAGASTQFDPRVVAAFLAIARSGRLPAPVAPAALSLAAA